MSERPRVVHGKQIPQTFTLLRSSIGHRYNKVSQVTLVYGYSDALHIVRYSYNAGH